MSPELCPLGERQNPVPVVESHQVVMRKGDVRKRPTAAEDSYPPVVLVRLGYETHEVVRCLGDENLPWRELKVLVPILPSRAEVRRQDLRRCSSSEYKTVGQCGGAEPISIPLSTDWLTLIGLES
jgi:hypothetical protein